MEFLKGKDGFRLYYEGPAYYERLGKGVLDQSSRSVLVSVPSVFSSVRDEMDID